MCVGKLKRDKRRKRKGNNPFGRKGKVGAQQTDSTERTSIQPPSSTDRIVPSGSGAQGSGAPTKKNATAFCTCHKGFACILTDRFYRFVRKI